MKQNSKPLWCDLSIIQYESTNQYKLSDFSRLMLNTISLKLYKKSGCELATLANTIYNKVKELALFKDLTESAYFKCEFQLQPTDLINFKSELVEWLNDEYPSIENAGAKAFRSAISVVKSRCKERLLNPECAEPTWSEARFTKWSDLNIAGSSTNQWASASPSLIQIPISDMVLSETIELNLQFSDLHPFLMPLADSPLIGLILTNQPTDLAQVISRSDCFPPNFCVLTSISGPDPESLQRLQDLKSINATTRGIVIDPMISRIPSELLNLDGIHWVIVSGQCSDIEQAAPFDLAWAKELRDHCKEKGVAFFLNQLGSRPTIDNKNQIITDPFGANWNEWDEALQIREYPEAFRSLTASDPELEQDAIFLISGSCTSNKSNKLIEVEIVPNVSSESEFDRLDKIVREGITNFITVGTALVTIKKNELWKESFNSWPAYCRSINGMGRTDAYRYIQAGQIVIELAKQSPIGDNSSVPMPTAPAQLRPLGLLKDPNQWYPAWSKAVNTADGNVPTEEQVKAVVNEIRYPEGPPMNQVPPKEMRKDLMNELINAITAKGLLGEFNDILMRLEKVA